ncbi:DNA-processing protein DprA [Actinomadura keratinilytica]
MALFDRLRGEGPPLPGATAGRMAGLRLRARDARPELDLAAARDAGARFVCPGDVEWPAQLDDLGDARPLGLWVRGTPSLRFWALRSVALVGARACTDYGAHAAGLLGAGLAERGWVVVSGGAYGIDGAAHRATLGAGGATVAVLACGVDSPYPRGHAQLIARIAEQGLVVSELPPGDHPTPSRFVLRNRVIAALTRGTVVVEAAHRSGALSTARAALRLGRAVMGVPGPVTSGLSAASTNCCAERATWWRTPVTSSNSSAASGNWLPRSPVRCCPETSCPSGWAGPSKPYRPVPAAFWNGSPAGLPPASTRRPPTSTSCSPSATSNAEGKTGS